MNTKQAIEAVLKAKRTPMRVPGGGCYSPSPPSPRQYSPV
jgi:hypothetical protein